MSNDKFIDDMSLEGKPEKPEKLDMELESPSALEIGVKLREIFPYENTIEVETGFKLVKMAAGNYTLNNKTPLEDLTAKDLNKINGFLKSRKG